MKTVLISGASRGIGAACARRFAKEDCRIIITCKKDKTALSALQKEIEENYGVPCLAHVCDMGDFGAVSHLFSQIPSPDILINNAGISYVGLLHEMSPAQWDDVLRNNLSSVFYACKAALPAMIERQCGCIINISSVWGNMGASMETAYSASKGGVNAFTKALAKELAPSHIAVNAIAPGLIDTDMNGHLLPEEKEAVISAIPADRPGTPLEVADLAFQIANAPLYMTGQIISLDGGWC